MEMTHFIWNDPLYWNDSLLREESYRSLHDTTMLPEDLSYNSHNNCLPLFLPVITLAHFTTEVIRRPDPQCRTASLFTTTLVTLPIANNIAITVANAKSQQIS
jgi:hypothetical protein